MRTFTRFCFLLFTVSLAGCSYQATLPSNPMPLPPQNALLNGHYAFYATGGFQLPCGPQTPTPTPLAIVGSLTADGHGNITQGEYDGTICGTAISAHNFTGVYVIGADHGGRLVMTNPLFAFDAFAFSVAKISGGVAHEIQFIPFNTDQVASGLMRLQDLTAFSNNPLHGNYVYGIGGAPVAGLANFDGSGGVTGPGITGSYGAPSLNGRVTGVLNGANYALYIVDTTQSFFAGDMGAGEMHAQQSGAFTNANFNGPLVRYRTTNTILNSQLFVKPFIDVLTSDGNGNLTGTSYSPGFAPQTIATTYSVQPNGFVTLGTGDTLLLYGQNTGYGSDANSLSTYENASSSATFDPSDAPYSIGSVQPPYTPWPQYPGNIGYPASAFAGVVSTDTSGNYVTTINYVATIPFVVNTFSDTAQPNAPPSCPGAGCTQPIPLSATRALGFQYRASQPTVLVYQK